MIAKIWRECPVCHEDYLTVRAPICERCRVSLSNKGLGVEDIVSQGIAQRPIPTHLEAPKKVKKTSLSIGSGKCKDCGKPIRKLGTWCQDCFKKIKFEF